MSISIGFELPAARQRAPGRDWGDPERIAVNVETLYREFDPSRPAVPVPQLFVRMAEWSDRHR